MKKLLFLLLLLTPSTEAQNTEAQNRYGTVTVWFWKNDNAEESEYTIRVRYVLSSNPKVSSPTFTNGLISGAVPQNSSVFYIDEKWDSIIIELRKIDRSWKRRLGDHRATPIQGKYSIIITRPNGQRTINSVKWYNENGGESDILFEQLTSEIILTR